MLKSNELNQVKKIEVNTHETKVLYEALKQYKKAKTDYKLALEVLNRQFQYCQDLLNEYDNNQVYIIDDLEFNNIEKSKSITTDNKKLEEFLNKNGKSINDFKYRPVGFQKPDLQVK